MDDYYDYINTKINLAQFITQFYQYELNIKDANKLNIPYDPEDVNNDEVKCLYHYGEAEGLYLWQMLGIEKDFLSYSEGFALRTIIRREPFKEDFNYHQAYLKNLLTICNLVRHHYPFDLSVRDYGGQFKADFDIDEYNGVIKCYDHLYESTGERAFVLLGIEEEIISDSEMLKLQESINEKYILTLKR